MGHWIIPRGHKETQTFPLPLQKKPLGCCVYKDVHTTTGCTEQHSTTLGRWYQSTVTILLLEPSGVWPQGLKCLRASSCTQTSYLIVTDRSNLHQILPDIAVCK